MSTFSELIDFTRSSTGTYLDSVVYGDELVTNGDFSNGTTGWSSASDGVGNVVDGQLVITSSNPSDTAYAMSQSFTVVQGESYKVSANLVSTTGDSIQCRAGSTNTSASYGTLDSNNSFGNVSMIVAPTTNTMWITLYGFGAGDSATFDNISVKEIIGGQGTAGTPLLRTADTNEPRLEYDASGQPLGLLIEEQRSNLLHQSEAFNNVYWGKVQLNTLSNGVTAPDGTTDTITLSASTTNGAYISRSNLGSAGQGYTVSVFAKAGTHDIIRITNQSSGSTGGWFDLTNGTTLTSNGANNVSRIEYVGNGWYRCSRYFDSWINTNNAVLFGVSLSDGSTQSAVGDTVSLWGAQLESGAFPTSYIPTSGSTVTRNSDVCSLPLERYHHNAQSYTMYAEFESTPRTPSNFERVWALSNDASPTNYVQLQFNTVNKMQVYSVYNDSANMTGNISNIEIADTTNKIALKVDGTSLNLACNGTLRSGALTNEIENFKKLHIGIANSEAFGWINTHIKVIRSYAKGYTNAQLIELTKPSSSPTMSLTFDGQATSELVEGLHD